MRQAREERGFTIADVAEQTRISSLYLQSIENDDYRPLPGGIFNKGFVKSYAKFVGVNEAEALDDYSALISQTTNSPEGEELRVYRPQVLTDDRSGSSMIPTVLLAVVILCIMTAGILFLVDYLRQPTEAPVANLGTKTEGTPAVETKPESTPAPIGSPDMASLKIEFKALSEPVSLTATNDGKISNSIVAPGTAANFEPKESLKLSYSKSLANVVQLVINGKEIILPAQPLMPKRNAIEFEINKDNLVQIWTSGTISADVPSAVPIAGENTDLPANSTLPTLATTPVTTPVATPTRPTLAPKPATPTNTVTNTPGRPTPDRKPKETPATPKPAVTNSIP